MAEVSHIFVDFDEVSSWPYNEAFVAFAIVS